MTFQFKEIPNQDSAHANESIQYFSDITFNANEPIILDIIVETLKIGNEENRKSYIFKLKEYYTHKGIYFNNEEFEQHVDNFLKENIGNVKGAFLEVLIYKLIYTYCINDKIYKECEVRYNGNRNNHPYDIITINNHITNLIDIKFSCHHLKKTHLDYLLEYSSIKNFKSYLISLDTLTQINHKLELIKIKNNLTDEEFENIKTNLNLISKNSIYKSILFKKCLIN